MPTRALVTRYEQTLELFPDRWQRLGVVVLALVALSWPLFANSHWLTVGNVTLTTIVASVSMMILTGFTGQVSLGHAGFMAVGAYTAAVLGSKLGIPFWLIFPIAGIAAAGVGLMVGPFALRLQGLYLAIVTVGLIFVVNHVLLSFPAITGGPAGIAAPMHSWFPEAAERGYSTFGQDTWRFTIGGTKFKLGFEQKLYLLFLPIAVATTLFARNLASSAAGRAMMAVRDHDLAAAVMGVNPAAAKITAFGVSSFFAGVAGAMFAFQQQFITVDPPFNLQMSVQYVAIIVLGGVGTVFGAVAGAISFTMLSPLAEMVGPHIPFVATLSSGQQTLLLFSIVVCAFLIFEPLGLYGIWLRIKRYFVAWPFSY